VTLASGARIGVYEVTALIGRGGMGEVYRARDTKLRRDVALKILPDSFAADPARVARFRREAHVLASLNHPHIAAIYGFEDGGATSTLVLELVEGPTLADRIRHSPLSLDEAWPIARQIALALEAAHDQGIVHRDLKPANIKVKDDGTVKVLDFGLARAMDPAGAGLQAGPDALSQSPTLTSPAMTQAGALLGTAAYMSPELARGRAADKRTDVWGFGCVLYEMLTGRPAYDGEDMAEVLGAVVRLEPDWAGLPSSVPPAVVAVLKRCLQKDPKLRMRDIADVRFEIEEAFAASGSAGHPVVTAAPRAAYAGWVVAAFATIVAAVALFRSPAPIAEEPQETRLEIVTPPADDPFSFAMAPDGRQVVFQARSEGRSGLWLRSFDSERARLLPGTDGAILPFWSADSRSIAFFAESFLKRLDLAGGFVRTLAPAPQPRRGSWNADGTILFGASSVGPLNRVPADGGTLTEATTLTRGHANHRWPTFLPEGRRFLYLAMGSPDVRGVYLGSLGDSNAQRVVEGDSAFSFVFPDHLLLARQGALWAQRLSPDSTRGEGELIPVAPAVAVSVHTTGLGAFSSSSVGSIAYRASAGESQLVWFDRSGRRLDAAGPPDGAQTQLTQLSLDGRTAAVYRVTNGNSDVWLIDLERGVSRRMTFDPGIDGDPIISPDGSRIVYVSDRTTHIWNMYARRSDGTASEALLLASDEHKNPADWSPDGRYILYSSQNPETGFDLWVLPLDDGREPVAVARTPFQEFRGRFSPDGRWVAYDSNESGRSEIYLQPFPGPGPRSQISVGGGSHPKWRRDGRELFYRAPDDRLMAASIAPVVSGLDVGPARELFTLPRGDPLYEPSPDGQQFLVSTVVSEASPITVILDWTPPGN
jgi:Tol biopolymer transport system component